MPPSIPTESESGVFQVDFENLIKVLGQNLYANPKAAVRELIQNASDSCVRRREAEDFQPAIQVIAHPEERLLIFDDNGSGMSKDEVVQDLASIGGGRTRRVRQWLETSNPAAARMLIGQFGIGFLSAFVIADKVVVDTFSVGGGLPVRWICEGTGRYQIMPGDRSEPGTRVTLHLKPAHYDLLEEDVLRETIIRYADFIAFPIPEPLSSAGQPHAGPLAPGCRRGGVRRIHPASLRRQAAGDGTPCPRIRRPFRSGGAFHSPAQC